MSQKSLTLKESKLSFLGRKLTEHDFPYVFLCLCSTSCYIHEIHLRFVGSPTDSRSGRRTAFLWHKKVINRRARTHTAHLLLNTCPVLVCYCYCFSVLSWHTTTATTLPSLGDDGIWDGWPLPCCILRGKSSSSFCSATSQDARSSPREESQPTVDARRRRKGGGRGEKEPRARGGRRKGGATSSFFLSLSLSLLHCRRERISAVTEA